MATKREASNDPCTMPPSKRPSSSPSTLPESPSPPPSSPPIPQKGAEDEKKDADQNEDDLYVYHVFSKYYLWDYKWPEFGQDTHCSVFATRKEARAAAKEEVKAFCMDYSTLAEEYYEDFPDDPKDVEDKYDDDGDDEEYEYNEEVGAVEENDEEEEEEEEAEDEEKNEEGEVEGSDRIRIQTTEGSWVEAWVEAREVNMSLGDVWQLKVRGATRGIFNSMIGAVKAVLRETKALQKSIRGRKSKPSEDPGEVAGYKILNDGLEVVAIKGDGSTEVVVRVEAWDLQN